MHTINSDIEPKLRRFSQPNKVGLVFAALLGGWHVTWVMLIAAKAAQPLIDFIFWAHMLAPVYHVQPLDPVAAITLLVVTATIGYVAGYLGAIIWNEIHKA